MRQDHYHTVANQSKGEKLGERGLPNPRVAGAIGRAGSLISANSGEEARQVVPVASQELLPLVEKSEGRKCQR